MDKKIQEALAKEQTVNLFDDSGMPSSTDVVSPSGFGAISKKNSANARPRGLSNAGFTVGGSRDDNAFSQTNQFSITNDKEDDNDPRPIG